MSDEMVSGPAEGGQPEPIETTEAPEVSGGQPQPEPFFVTRDSSGKEHRFGSKEELEKAFNSGVLMQSDYTRKTMSLAEERKKFQEEMQKEKEAIEQMKKEYNEYDSFLKKRPDVYQRLKQMMNQPVSPDGILEQSKQHANEKYSEIEERLKKIEQFEQSQRLAEERSKLYKTFEERYPDFKREAVEELMTQIDPNNPEHLLNLLYRASKGGQDPAAMEARMAQNQARKQSARLVPGTGAGTGGPAKTPKSFAEAAELAKAELRGG